MTEKTQPTNAELLPCPFCGEAAKHSFNSLYGDMSMAVCKSCGATAYAPKWNRRAVLAKWGASHGQAPATQQAGVSLRRIERTTFPSSPAHRVLSAFCGAMSDSGIDGAGMRAAMLWFLGYEETYATPTAQAAESAPALDRARIRDIFMAHGFTVKDGQTDLKQYVYDAADALLSAARDPAESVLEDAARYRWLREGNEAKHGAAWHVAVNLYGRELDAAIDAAMNKGGAT